MTRQHPTAKRAAKKPVEKNPKDPAKLWSMSPKQRESDTGGSWAAALTGSPAIKFMSLAKGRAPGPTQDSLDARATIRAGIAAIRQAGLGYKTVDPAKLHSNLIGQDKNDKILIRSAGTGKTLQSAAAGMRKKVVQLGGRGLAKAAWGLRGLYVLAAYEGFATAQGVAALGVNFIPVVGQIASAALAAKGGIEQTVLSGAAKDFQKMVKQGMAEAARTKKKKVEPKKADHAINTALAASFTQGGEAEDRHLARAKSAPPDPADLQEAPSYMPWIIGGAVAVLAILVLLPPRSK